MTPEQIQELRQQYGYNPSTLNLNTQGSRDVQSDEVNKRLQTVFGDTTKTSQETPQENRNALLNPQLGGVKYLANNFLAPMAKDAANALVVTPTSRATEAVTRTFFPNSLAAKGYESYADANQPVDSGVFGIQVAQPGNNFEQGARTVASDAAKSASYLIPYGKIAGGVAGATGSKLLGNMAAMGGGGYLGDIGNNLADQNQTVGEALTPGMGTAVGVAIPLGVAGAQASGRALQKLGTGLTESVLPRDIREAGIIQTYKADKPFFQRISEVLAGTEKAPQTLGKTAVETTAGQTVPGLFGTKSQIGIQAKRAQSALWNDSIKPALDSAGVQVDLPEYFNAVEKKIIESTPEKSRQTALLDALNSFREDYAGTNAVSLSKLQQLKEGWAEFVPEKFYKGQNIAGNAKQVSALLADEARQTIYDTLGPEVKKAYFDYGNLKALTEMGKSSMTGQKLKGGTGGFVSELYSQAVTPIGTIGGQVIYKTGKGLEVIGNAGAKTLDAVLGINSNIHDLSIPTKTETVQSTAKIPNMVKNMSNIDTSIPQTGNNASGKMSGFASITGDSTPKIHPEDADSLNDFLKYLNGETTVPKATAEAMRKEAVDLADHYGIKLGKNDRNFADNIAKALYEAYHKFPGFADLGIIPKLAIGTAVATGGLKAYVASKNK